MKKNNLIYALGLKTEGGLIILNYILEREFKKSNTIIYLDSNIEHLKFLKHVNIKISKSNFISRIILDFKLRNQSFDNVIYLGSIPPIFKLKAKTTYLLFQNINIIPSTFHYSFFFKLDFVRYLVFLYGKNNVDIFLTINLITYNYLYLYKNKVQKIQQVEIGVFDKFNKNIKINLNRKIEYDFIYPASGLKHKNHNLLIKSLITLSHLNIYPSIIFTLSEKEYSALNINNIKKKYNLKIINFRTFNRKKFYNLLKKSRALIYPSISESLGLPLLEASHFGLDILTSNLSFAQDYNISKYTFNPLDSFSIAKTIHKYLEDKNLIDNTKQVNIHFDEIIE